MNDISYIKSFCLHCHENFEFPEHGIGESVNCPHCGELVILTKPTEQITELAEKLFRDDNILSEKDRIILSDKIKDCNLSQEDTDEAITQKIGEDIIRLMKDSFSEFVSKNETISDEQFRQWGMEVFKKWGACPQLKFFENHPKYSEYCDKNSLYEVRFGKIPESGLCDIPLDKNEVCYFVYSGMPLFEYRRVRNSVGYGGVSASIPIFKGIRFRVGKFATSPDVSTELTRIDTGTVYLTNKRVIFMGEYGNKVYPISKLLGMNYNDMFVELERTQGKNPFFGDSNGISSHFVEILLRLFNDKNN